MGQLFTTFGVDWQHLLFQLVNFGLLLGALTYFLYRPVLRIIDERRESIAEGVRKAAAADARLNDAKAEGDKMVGDAAKQAEGLVATARLKAEERGSEMLKAAQERADQVMAEAKARAEEEKRQALASSQRDIARAAMLAAEKIMREKSA